MDYATFAAQLKSRKKLPPVHVFYGEEELLRRRGAELLRGTDPTFEQNTLKLSSSDTNWRTLLSEICTPPLEGGRKLVVLIDEGNWVQKESSNLKAYAGSPSPSALLVTLSPGAKCPVSFQSKNLVPVSCRPLKSHEVQRWIQTEVERRGKSIDRAAADQLASRAGTDLAALDGYLESLTLHAGARGRIRPEDVEALVGQDPQFKVFELTLAAARKDRAAALRILHGLPAREKPQSILGLLAWQYRRMTEAKRLLESGVRRFEVTSRLKITYYAEKFLGLVDTHSAEELLEKHRALVDADLALKTSGRGAEEAIMDTLVCQLADPCEVMHG